MEAILPMRRLRLDPSPHSCHGPLGPAARLASIDIDDDMRAAMRLHNLRVMISAERRGRMRRDQQS